MMAVNSGENRSFMPNKLQFYAEKLFGNSAIIFHNMG